MQQSNQYILWNSRTGISKEKFITIASRATSEVLLSRCLQGTPVENYSDHESTNRIFIDIDPDDAMQIWLRTDRNIRTIEVISDSEIIETYNIMKKDGHRVVLINTDDIIMLVTEPLFEDDYSRAIAQKESLLFMSTAHKEMDSRGNLLENNHGRLFNG